MSSNDAHRSIFVRLTTDRDFKRLSELARLTWFYLKTSPECGPKGLFILYPSTLAARLFPIEDEEMGLPSAGDRKRLTDALNELPAYIEGSKDDSRSK